MARISPSFLAGVPLLGILFLSFSLGGSYRKVLITGSQNIGSIGAINYPSKLISLWNVSIDVDAEKVIGINNLSLGIMLGPARAWLLSQPLREKAINSNFKMVRFWDYGLKPCISWNERNFTGTFDWTKLDVLIQSVYDIGAEPMICIGAMPSSRTAWHEIPPGMAIDPITGLPSPESFSAYSAHLVNHFKEKGWRVKYWEIWNEPEHYLFDRGKDGNPIWGVFNETRLKYFTELFNAASKRMHEVDSEILIGTDASLYQGFFDYFVQHAEGVGFLSFHKYDAWGTWLYEPEGYLSDQRILKKAGRVDIGGGEWKYTPEEARQLWRQIRGVDVPVICSESNMNSCFVNGTDPRIQQIIGAVWYAEEIRTFVLSDVRYSVYYKFASDDSPDWNTTKLTRGAGFGMVNATPPHKEWYIYLVNHLIGSNLELGDVIYSSSSSNRSAVSVLAWKHKGQLKVLLNHKVKNLTTTANIRFSGLEIGPETETKILTINNLTQEIQEEILTWSKDSTTTLKGYSVMLLSLPASKE